jgi:hypothetical protein
VLVWQQLGTSHEESGRTPTKPMDTTCRRSALRMRQTAVPRREYSEYPGRLLCPATQRSLGIGPCEDHGWRGAEGNGQR